MKRKLFAVLIWMLVACMLVPGFAEDGGASGDTHTHQEFRSDRECEEPTCENSGKNVYRCEICGDVLRTETVPALGHNWGDWEIQAEATCLEAGVEIRTCMRCNKATDTRTISPKGHAWSSWTVTKAATCADDGEQTRTCSACGKQETQTISKNNAHQFGEWTVTKAATCSEDGVQTRSCSVCGKQESNIIPKTGEHSWSNWTVSKEPTCLMTGMKTRKCTVCGKTENSYVDKQEHQWSEWTTRKEPTCTERGKQQRYCARCGATENMDIKALGHEAEEWTVTKEPTCQKVGEKEGACIRCGKKLTKKLNRVDHDYGEWETVTEASDFSKGKQESVCRFCKRKKTAEYYPEGTLAKDLDNDPEAVRELQAELAALGFLKKDITGTYDKATIEAVKKAQKGLGLKQDGICWPGLSKVLGLKKALSAAAAEANAETQGGIGKGGDEEGTGLSPSNFKLQLEVKKTSPKKDYYFLGDELTYEWTLTNASKSSCKKTKMYAYDIKKGIKQKGEAIEEIGTLKPGESATGTFTYTVTDEDVLTGKFSFGFISKGSIGGKAESNPVMFTHFASEGIGGVIVEKKVISTPDNGSFYEEGEEIRYEIKVTNNMAKDIIAMELRDSLAKMDDRGYRTIQSGETLAAGEACEIHFSYIVTEDDVKNTKVTNIASVYWSTEEEEFTETRSEPVTVPTAPAISDRGPRFKKLAGEACTPSLTAMGEGVAQRDLIVCTEHTETVQEAGEMMDDGDYEAASLLWDGETEKLYLEWEKSTSGESRRIAENEQAAFEHQMTALEDSLSLVAGEIEAKAIVAEERMEKCIGLCYELHTAPEGRPDSASGAHTELKKGKTAKNCSRSVDYTEAGHVHLEDDQCESHTLISQLTQTLLAEAENDGERETAWLRAQSNWLFELNRMYDAWYLSAEPAQKALIAADRMSFYDLINARRETLAYMYPDDPATVAEVLANMIMHRTELICSILHKTGVLKD